MRSMWIKALCLLAVLLGVFFTCACGAVENQVKDIAVCLDEDGNYYAVSSDGKAFLFYYPGNTGESFCVPDGVETVADGAFHGAEHLRSLSFSPSVKTIGDIFYEYIELETVIIPASVESYKGKPFEIHSRTLKELTVACEIGSLHVGGCTSLESIVLPEAPKTLGGLMFDGCTRLTSIRVDGKETAQDEWFEAYCAQENGYPVLYIPGGVERLEAELINSCVNVYIPDSVQSVDYVLYRYLACEGGFVSMPAHTEILNAPGGSETEIYSAAKVIRREATE